MANQTKSKVVSLGDWIITMILTSIPVVGFIMLLVWAFSDSTPQSKKNWALAALIFMVIGVALYSLFFASILAAVAASGGY